MDPHIDENTDFIVNLKANLVYGASVYLACKHLIPYAKTKLNRNFWTRKKGKKLFRELFYEGRNISVCTAKKWRKEYPKPDPTGFPNDFDAALSYANFFSIRDKDIDHIDEFDPEYFRTPIRQRAKIVCTGSPASNIVTQHFLPWYQWKYAKKGIKRTQSEPKRFNNRLHKKLFKYSFCEDLVSERLPTNSRSRGKVTRKTQKRLIVRKNGKIIEEWNPKGYGDSGEVDRDFLLVTKVPWNNRGGSLISFSGGHGVGVKAVQKLFEDGLTNKELKRLERLKGVKAYQFVLEITDVKQVEGVGAFPKTFQLSEDLPPEVLPPDILRK